ncbi:MAG: hypothetical protein RBT65_08565 [Methanolobus sp.]|jgi:signal transduction histidine kinase|nr:hypothetical protein [Methanolobus sp.]
MAKQKIQDISLSIDKKYLEMHIGKKPFESEPQNGSAFTFELPLYQ